MSVGTYRVCANCGNINESLLHLYTQDYELKDYFLQETKSLRNRDITKQTYKQLYLEKNLFRQADRARKVIGKHFD